MKFEYILIGCSKLNCNVSLLDFCSVEQVVALDAQNIVAVSCGDAHTLALNDKGQVYAWGLDSDGQLGLLGSEECIRVPR
jgi:alpha-tubulin suppressor-like RCC1 family protein